MSYQDKAGLSFIKFITETAHSSWKEYVCIQNLEGAVEAWVMMLLKFDGKIATKECQSLDHKYFTKECQSLKHKYFSHTWNKQKCIRDAYQSSLEPCGVI